MSALAALSAYESSEEEQERLPGNDNTPKRPRPLSRIDLRRKLDRELVFPDQAPQSRINLYPQGPQKTGHGSRHETERPKTLSNIDLRRKITGVPGFPQLRSPGPRKMAPNCSTEYRQLPLNTSSEHTRQVTNKPKNWWDPPEEEEAERLSEDDISTDKCEGNESS